MKRSLRRSVGGLFFLLLGACTVVTTGSGTPGGAVVTSSAPAGGESSGAPVAPTGTSAGGACASVRLFDDTSFQGRSVELGPGRYDLPQLEASGMENDSTRSICVPAGWRVTLFQNAGFDGETREVTAPSSDLGDFQGSASAIVVVAP